MQWQGDGARFECLPCLLAVDASAIEDQLTGYPVTNRTNRRQLMAILSFFDIKADPFCLSTYHVVMQTGLGGFHCPLLEVPWRGRALWRNMMCTVPLQLLGNATIPGQGPKVT